MRCEAEAPWGCAEDRDAEPRVALFALGAAADRRGIERADVVRLPLVVTVGAALVIGIVERGCGLGQPYGGVEPYVVAATFGIFGSSALTLSDAVVHELETMLGLSVLRIAGKDYTDTSIELATFELSPAGTGMGWNPASTSILVVPSPRRRRRRCRAGLHAAEATRRGPPRGRRVEGSAAQRPSDLLPTSLVSRCERIPPTPVTRALLRRWRGWG